MLGVPPGEGVLHVAGEASGSVKVERGDVPCHRFSHSHSAKRIWKTVSWMEGKLLSTRALNCAPFSFCSAANRRSFAHRF
jgi:hypothetical protein